MRTVKICNLRMYNLSLFSFFSFVELNTNKNKHRNRNTSVCKYACAYVRALSFVCILGLNFFSMFFLVNLLGCCRE